MMKTSFKLCPRRHERKQHETVKFSSSGLCCNKTMHVKTGVYIIVYFEALQLTAFCTYVFTKIFISCCGIDFLILLLINFVFILITFILNDGAKNGDILKLKASVILFIVRLFFFLLWSLMIAAVNIFDLDGFEYFKEYFVTRLTFATFSVVYSILAIIIVFKCHQYFLRLKIITTRGKATSLQLPCCNVTEITVIFFFIIVLETVSFCLMKCSYLCK